MEQQKHTIWFWFASFMKWYTWIKRSRGSRFFSSSGICNEAELQNFRKKYLCRLSGNPQHHLTCGTTQTLISLTAINLELLVDLPPPLVKSNIGRLYFLSFHYVERSARNKHNNDQVTVTYKLIPHAIHRSSLAKIGN